MILCAGCNDTATRPKPEEILVKDILTIESTSEVSLPESKLVIKLAHTYPETHPQHIALRSVFVPIVEEASNWNIRVELYPNCGLGSEELYTKGVISGIVEMCIVDENIFSEVSELSLIRLPYLFDDYHEALNKLNEVLRPAVEDDMAAIGVRNLGFTVNGFNQISIYKRQASGLIASEGGMTNREFLNSMGYESRPVAIEEMNILLDSGRIYGHDYPVIMSYLYGWYENQEKIILTNHIIDSDMYLMNEKLYQSLSEKNKSIIHDAIEATISYGLELVLSLEEDIYDIYNKEDIIVEELQKGRKEELKETFSISSTTDIFDEALTERIME